IDLCVAGPNPFGSALAELVGGVTVRGRQLVTRDLDDPRAMETCQLLFIPALSATVRKELLVRASTLPVLTVGDYPGFLDEGGIVNLRLVEGRVRFEINLDAANRTGVRLSSQLLRLALHVRG